VGGIDAEAERLLLMGHFKYMGQRKVNNVTAGLKIVMHLMTSKECKWCGG
jgi:hypothetical protein